MIFFLQGTKKKDGAQRGQGSKALCSYVINWKSSIYEELIVHILPALTANILRQHVSNTYSVLDFCYVEEDGCIKDFLFF